MSFQENKTFHYLDIINWSPKSWKVLLKIEHPKDDDEEKWLFMAKSQVEVYESSRIISIPQWICAKEGLI